MTFFPVCRSVLTCLRITAPCMVLGQVLPTQPTNCVIETSNEGVLTPTPPPTPNCGGRESLSTCCLWQPPLLFYYDRQPTSILLLCNVASFQLPVTLPPPSSPAHSPPSRCLPLPSSPTFLFRQRRVAPVRRPIAASTACAKGGVSSFFVLQELSVKRG